MKGGGHGAGDAGTQPHGGSSRAEEGRSRPTLNPFLIPQEVQRISPPLSGVRNSRVRVSLLGRWWQVRGGAGLNMPPVQAPLETLMCTPAPSPPPRQCLFGLQMSRCLPCCQSPGPSRAFPSSQGLRLQMKAPLPSHTPSVAAPLPSPLPPRSHHVPHPLQATTTEALSA